MSLPEDDLITVDDFDSTAQAAEDALFLRWKVTEPSIVQDMPDDVYHSDPVTAGSVSHSELKVLMGGTPAKFRYWKTHPRGHKAAFDLGHAAHQLVLGVGAPIAEIKADDWRSPRTRDLRDALYAAGSVPLLTRDYQVVHGMAIALQSYPEAVALLSGDLATELSMFGVDRGTGLWLRARFDCLRGDGIGVDYKTTARAASRAQFEKVVYDLGYDTQAAFYLDVAAGLGVEADRFRFIVQETAAPYEVAVYALSDDYLAIGRYRYRQALNRLADCFAAGDWPGYPADGPPLDPPMWVRRQYEDLLGLGVAPAASTGSPEIPADLLAELDRLAN